MAPIAPSDIYPAVRRFLTECGLQKTLKALDKETGVEADDAAPKSKKAKALAELVLTEACQLWLDARSAPAIETNGATPNGASERDAEKPKKKRKSLEAEAEAAEAETAPAEEEPPAEAPKKKRKREAEAQPEEPAAAEAEAEEAGEAEAEQPKKSKKKKDEKKAGTPFQRIDDEKWRKTLTDDKFIDNSHKAKQKFGGSAGDSWGDQAAEDLLKVKGKGFRKEMAKKKRASWRGGGEIDQGVNSVKFEDSSDEE
uniref:Srp40 C-terminal domain-containing protein n=1 Tax=Alexandrium monilatum TaxID=311494 RepID=A0A7S4PU94_9DINO|mmetsp:Transcript_108177/g.334095  ORF Transcript_108177/g.334095 Transcript_108177/m.334095 type:complete len:255 (-) Transcript_108177:165-929(-)|eukprot:CAMPEP_0175241564 /NCGR_PEP_ID=MMETSP0093-20121207/30624_1 /TAXON_ID=311494 /ORGANISM="Alexandrium monilatum, Strain CCMP3105" /LENGTH=254 /DNA_ID=CAMNT_0016535625 /DNA_START=31 /DNA_END=795 /DNA_ORIENTATION=+